MDKVQKYLRRREISSYDRCTAAELSPPLLKQSSKNNSLKVGEDRLLY